MIRHFILILLLTVSVYGRDVERNVEYIDRDGDGYGVASSKGPDGDDSDPAITDAKSVRQKYPFIKKLLVKRGYKPREVLVYNRKGGQIWANIIKKLQPGTVVLFREGVYPGRHVFGFSQLSGGREAPIVFMAWPGEKVVFDGQMTCISVRNSKNLVFDGFILTNSQNKPGSGIKIHFSRNITFRNIESTGHKWGMKGMQGLVNLKIENCVFHDNHWEHGVYLGARERGNKFITIRDSLFYRNGRHGIQHNGRVEKLKIESCLIHTNNMGGISLINGTNNSVIRGNTIFNNNKQGIIFYTYAEPQHNIHPFGQSNNLIEQNVIWSGTKSWNGKGTPSQSAAVVFNDVTPTGNMEMKDNVFKDNVFVTQRYPVIDLRQNKFVKWIEVQDNILYRADKSIQVFNLVKQPLSLQAVKLLNDKITGNQRKNPKFNDVSIEYFNSPGSFDFTMTGK